MLKLLKSEIMHDKHSFKLVDSVQDIFSKPGHLVFIIALLLFTMVNAHVSDGTKSTSYANSDSRILGEATSIEANDPENQLLMYKLSVQSLVVPYIEQRVGYLSSLERRHLAELDRDEWRGIIQQTQNEVMDLVVPARFKDTHLLIVAALMEEGSIIENLADFDLSSFEAVSKSWSDILIRNSWLNERQAL